jgi:GNAT superfamily N-acetyltransferase
MSHVAVVDTAAGARAFRAAGARPYRQDPNWVPPLPGEERVTFDVRRNPALDGVEYRRWVLLEREGPTGRIAAFAPAHRPGVGYIGFFESPDDSGAAYALLAAAEEWLSTRGRRECYGPVAVTPRDRIGLLTEGFDRPALLFTPYNPPYYRALLEGAGWSAHQMLSAYAWDAAYVDPRSVRSLGQRAENGSSIRIRQLRLGALRQETRLIAQLINEALADAWHFDPVSEREADDMARLLRAVIDPAIALVAEDGAGPCGVALAMPDVNWLWRRAGGRVFPFGWAQLLRWRRRIPHARMMVLGLSGRVHRTGLAARLIRALLEAGVSRGYVSGEMSQVYDDNRTMRRMLDRMGFPVVRRYAVFTRRLEA